MNHFIVWPSFGGIGFQLALRTLERFAVEVPVLRDASKPGAP